jgi:hypothetical protein
VTHDGFCMMPRETGVCNLIWLAVLLGAVVYAIVSLA